MFIAMKKCTDRYGHEWRRVSAPVKNGSFLVECVHCDEVGYEIQPAQVVSEEKAEEGLF